MPVCQFLDPLLPDAVSRPRALGFHILSPSSRLGALAVILPSGRSPRRPRGRPVIQLPTLFSYPCSFPPYAPISPVLIHARSASEVSLLVPVRYTIDPLTSRRRSRTVSPGGLGMICLVVASRPSPALRSLFLWRFYDLSCAYASSSPFSAVTYPVCPAPGPRVATRGSSAPLPISVLYLVLSSSRPALYFVEKLLL